MRLAILSDIHGNLPALEAVLADLDAAEGVDEIWVLGDLVALGPEPVRVLDRLSSIKGLRVTRGNTDRYVVTGDLPPPTVEHAMREPSVLPQVVEAASHFAWTRGMLAATGWLEWLSNLPLELTCELPAGQHVVGVHASPGRDDGRGMRADTTDEEMDALLAGCDADVLLTGHTHSAIDRTHNGIHVFNVGSVSHGPPETWQASYGVLEAGANGYTLRHRAVTYDHRAVAEATRHVNPPGTDFILSFFGGPSVVRRHPTWKVDAGPAT